MYLNFFNFNKEPFQMTPDSAFLFLSDSHQQALASIKYAVEMKKGLVLVVGAVGVGKTTVLKTYIEKLKSMDTRAITVLNPDLSFENLLKLMLRELGSSPQCEDTFGMMEQLRQALREENGRGHNVLLLIDDAQNMPVETLAELRMLVDTGVDKGNAIQVVFSAQPEFEKTLNLEELKQLKQRIAVKASIIPLSIEESQLYIHHRLKTAAEKESEIFSKSALHEIVKHASGIPRIINVICDNCLIRAFAYGQRKVSIEVAKEITRDYGSERHLPISFAAGLALAVLVSTGGYVGLAKVAPRGNVAATIKSKPAPETHSAPRRAYIHVLAGKGDALAKSIITGCDRVARTTMALVKKVTSNGD